MKRLDFLKKLKKEGKLKIVDPSDEIKEAYLKKSASYIDSAKLLFKHNKLEESISMTYYSMYYSLLSILFKFGIKSENHTGSIILLKDLFGLDDEQILKAKKERINKQYYVDFKLAKQDVLILIREAEKFNATIFDFLERVKSEDIEIIRKKFREMIK